MNRTKTKMVLTLSGLIFLAMPVSSAFAHEQHCEIKETQLGETMKYMKSELRAYVKGVKRDDAEKMRQHLNELLKLSSMAAEKTPIMIKNMHAAGMDHQQMDMAAMDHADMKVKGIPAMDHSNMDHGKMDSADHDMSTMPGMEGMSNEQHHQHMLYTQGMTKLNEQFKSLDKALDKVEIKEILGKIKMHIKKSHQQFRQDCN